MHEQGGGLPAREHGRRARDASARRATPTVAAVLLVAALALPVAAAPAPAGQPGRDAPPAEDLHPTRVIVRWADGARPDQVRAAERAEQARPVRSLRALGLDVVEATGGRSAAAVAAALARRPDVVLAEPDRRVHRLDTGAPLPDDPDLDRLWGLHNTGQPVGYAPAGTALPGGTAGADIDAPEAWAALADAGVDLAAEEDVVVAVLDTGVDISHPDLAGRIWVNEDEVPGNGVDDDGNGYVDDVHGWDFASDTPVVFDPRHADDHGTHVAGTIAAARDDAIGVAGVSRARIMPLKFLAPGKGWMSDAVEALDYAVANGARISNNSWGTSSHSSALADAIATAGGAGHLFVTAAGNSGANVDTGSGRTYPARYTHDSLVAVAATTAEDTLAEFSNWGPTSVDLGAPGQAIYSSVPGFAKVVVTDPEVLGHAAALHAFALGGVHDPADRVAVAAATLTALGVDGLPRTAVVVDDDRDGEALEQAWVDALGALGLAVTTCVPGEDDGPLGPCDHPDRLDDNDVVVWTTGTTAVDALDAADRTVLTALAGRGVPFVVEGPDVACGLVGDTPCRGASTGPDPAFLTEVLGAHYVEDHDRNPRLRGVPATSHAGIALDLVVTGDTSQVWADALAPATGARALVTGAPWTWLNGTSMAAPHVAGAAAVLLGARPELTPAQLKDLLLTTGKPLPTLDGATVSGRRLDLAAAVAALDELPTDPDLDPDPGPDPTPTPSPSPTVPSPSPSPSPTTTSPEPSPSPTSPEPAPTQPPDPAPRPAADTTASGPTLDGLPPGVTRLSGTDLGLPDDGRVGTAVAVSRTLYPGPVDEVVVATGTNAADALAGGPLAGRVGGPLLLVHGDTLPPVVVEELRRLAPRRITVLGGAAAVPDAVVAELDELAGVGGVRRLWGPDRHATAAAVARVVTARDASTTATPPRSDLTVHLATGDGFADALAAGPAATDGPVLLVARDALPTPAREALVDLAPSRVVVYGGPAVVGAGVLDDVEAATGVRAVRVAGPDRHATAAAIAEGWTGPLEAVFVVTGRDFPDALAAGAPAWALGAPVLLVDDPLPPSVAAALARLRPARVVAVGGPAVLPDDVLAVLGAHGR